ncbi:hypothetical protein ACFQJ7_02900 [Halovenus rubra]|uniref:Uncharacterized protein n=2 Tax=Halovenus rubra TaxID=869890 RepID=A0ACC7E2T2_9EURY
MLLGNASRAVLDEVRGHHWVVLVASDELLAVTREIIAALTTTTLADDWHEQIRRERVSVSHPPGDHPALASAYRGNARHLVTTNEELTATGMNLSVQSHMELSIRPPDAFQTLFEPESLYEGLFEEAYPGPDRDPRA